MAASRQAQSEPLAPRAVLVNPITFPRPVEELAPQLIEELRRLVGEHGILTVTISNRDLAVCIRDALPQLHITASVLMDIAEPKAAAALNGICDSLVPDGTATACFLALDGHEAAGRAARLSTSHAKRGQRPQPGRGP